MPDERGLERDADWLIAECDARVLAQWRRNNWDYAAKVVEAYRAKLAEVERRAELLRARAVSAETQLIRILAHPEPTAQEEKEVRLLRILFYILMIAFDLALIYWILRNQGWA